MFWIILFLTSLIVLCVIAKDNPTPLTICLGFMIAISGLISLSQGTTGLRTYPKFKGELEGIKALQNRIKDIKNASYKYEKDGTFIAGSIENYKQSTNLSNYITELAVKESEYNNRLERDKIYKKEFLLRHLAGGWAISDKIFTLETFK